MEEVRRFIRDKGHADGYQNLKITFIRGRNPDLFIKDENGSLVQKIDMSKMGTLQLHDMMIKNGFRRKPGMEKHPLWPRWDKNPSFPGHLDESGRPVPSVISMSWNETSLDGNSVQSRPAKIVSSASLLKRKQYLRKGRNRTSWISL